MQNPYPFYQALREKAPVFEIKRGSDSYFVISRHEDIKKVTKDTTAFSSNLVNILLDAGNGRFAMMAKPSLDVGPVDALALADPPLHTRQRKIAFGGLTSKLFVGLEDEIRKITIDLLSQIKKTYG